MLRGYLPVHALCGAKWAATVRRARCSCLTRAPAAQAIQS